jgi:hypothetical protein
MLVEIILVRYISTCQNTKHKCHNHSSARGNHTLRVKSHSASGNRTLSIKSILWVLKSPAKKNLVLVQITFVPV